MHLKQKYHSRLMNFKFVSTITCAEKHQKIFSHKLNITEDKKSGQLIFWLLKYVGF